MNGRAKSKVLTSSLPPLGVGLIAPRGGSRISEEGVQMYKRGVRWPNVTQNVLKFPMKIK